MPSQQKLSNRHAELEERIAEESKRPAPDFTALQALKKEKLKLKEQMTIVG